jgi:hypothetical protein
VNFRLEIFSRGWQNSELENDWISGKNAFKQNTLSGFRGAIVGR